MTYFRLTAKPMGGFLEPPGSPLHRYSVYEWTSKAAYDRGLEHKIIGCISLPAVLEHPDWYPNDIVTRVRDLMERADLKPSEEWVRQVYGYFRNCYAADAGSRNVSDLLIPEKGEPVLEPERHAGYLFVKDRFPEHEPRLDLINGPSGYGTRLCTKCDQRVQYAAKYDAWCVFDQTPDCPAGGTHEVPAP